MTPKTSIKACLFRFNRYMVECEFYQILLYQGHIFVLIDTWWNVNNLISKY